MNREECPGTVKKLDETVVNRIAAGEVIQRPCNALKELLENSLDANSTNIQITVKNGGLKLLQIQDNGTGIQKKDLPIVCERFTTSKLTTFEDLSSIATFGFRGEALASISHVAHLSIITRTRYDSCAYKASYEDGKLIGSIKPCAGNQGTQITAEDLFYNVPTRRKALKSFNEEHIKISDVVGRYSIHNPSVGFTLRKQGEGLAEIRTNPDSTHVDNIRIIYGNSIARSLEYIEAIDDILKFSIRGYVTNVNFTVKKSIFLLFINNRLVESQGLKRSVDHAYSLYIPKDTHPFVYLSLTIDPRNVDVNVHPTKHEVHFLHEDSIIEKVKAVVEAKLLGSNSSRIFYTQSKLSIRTETISSGLSVSEKSQCVTPSHLVRTDSGIQKLDKYFCSSHSTSTTFEDVSCGTQPRREIKLTSVLNMRKEISDIASEFLKDVLQDFKFVGAATPVLCFIQHKTELYLCNSTKLITEMFYQIMVNDFGNFGAVKFSEPMSIKELIDLAFELPEADITKYSTESEKSMLAESGARLLLSRAAMLNDYFSMEIDKAGNLLSVPFLLDNYVPDPEGIPLYLLRLVTEVNWDSELACFKSFCKETARFYVQRPSKDDFGNPTYLSVTDEKESGWCWTLEHILLPAMRRNLIPTETLFDERAVIRVASLPQLYKVFERC